MNGAQTTFKFKSSEGVAGIQRVTLQGNKSGSGRIKVILTGKDGTYPADPLDLPLSLTLALNDLDGQCGEYDFSDGCKTNRKLDKVLCR